MPIIPLIALFFLVLGLVTSGVFDVALPAVISLVFAALLIKRSVDLDVSSLFCEMRKISKLNDYNQRLHSKPTIAFPKPFLTE